MKKIMAIMLGMALASTTIVVAFGQDAPKKEDKKMPKKGKKKSTDAPKKEGGR